MKYSLMPTLVALCCTTAAHGASISASHQRGQPLATVMVSRYLVDKPELDLRNDGYPAAGVSNHAAVVQTGFTDTTGVASFRDIGQPLRYQPDTQQFTLFDLALINELPYALNVDRQRKLVWVNGNQSDTVLRFAIASEPWRVYPLPRKRFFSRDIEFDEHDGSVYTGNSHFPGWQIEGAQPSLIRIRDTAQ
jgi:hypothetical protein